MSDPIESEIDSLRGLCAKKDADLIGLRAENERLREALGRLLDANLWGGSMSGARAMDFARAALRGDSK